MGLVSVAQVAQARPASAADEVMAAEQARANALLHQDTAALDKIMADDVIFCHGSGMIDTKKSYIDAITSDALHYYAIDGSGMKVRMLGDKAAVLNGPLSLKVRNRTPDTREVKLQATAVYEKRGGRWQLISYQTTAVPASAAAPPVK
jgi:uncharacterized protein (TIGR02246 family)